MEHNEIEVKQNLANQLIEAADAILKEIKSNQLATTVDFDERSLLNMFNRDREGWSAVLLLALTADERAILEAFRISASNGQCIAKGSLPPIPTPNVWRNTESQLHRENFEGTNDYGYEERWYGEDDRTEWYLNGKWYKTEWCNEEGETHRENGPAIELGCGYKGWYINDQLHRENGPAIEHGDGRTEWHLNGKWQKTEWRNDEGQYHREDGPAIEVPDGYKAWYLNGYWKKTECHNTEGKLHSADGPAVIFPNGTKQWWLNGKLHRENAPAMEFYDGSKEWRLNGKLHRADGPAIEWSNGNHKAWYLNGKRHRMDGPALEQKIDDELEDYAIKEWSVSGKWLRTERRNAEGEIIEILNGSSVECADGIASWPKKGRVHFQWSNNPIDS